MNTGTSEDYSLFNIVFGEFRMNGSNVDAVVLFSFLLDLIDHSLCLWHVGRPPHNLNVSANVSICFVILLS